MKQIISVEMALLELEEAIARAQEDRVVMARKSLDAANRLVVVMRFVIGLEAVSFIIPLFFL